MRNGYKHVGKGFILRPGSHGQSQNFRLRAVPSEWCFKPGLLFTMNGKGYV
jgi:hypothetical protein